MACPRSHLAVLLLAFGAGQVHAGTINATRTATPAPLMFQGYHYQYWTYQTPETMVQSPWFATNTAFLAWYAASYPRPDAPSNALIISARNLALNPNTATSTTITYEYKFSNQTTWTAATKTFVSALHCTSGTLENTECATYSCPAGYTLDANGTTCTGCAPDSCEPAAGCVSTSPAACDDGNACTDDRCDATSGCVHSPRSCDDGKACTQDTCLPATGCTNTFTDAGCTCDAIPLPPLTFTRKANLNLGGVGCGLVGGTFGASLEFAPDFSFTPATCANTCAEEANGGGAVTATLSICGGGATITGKLLASTKRVHEETCTPAACSTGCSAGSCETDTFQGGVSGEFSRAVKPSLDKAFAGGRFLLKCNANLSAAAGVSGRVTNTQNTGVSHCATAVDSQMDVDGSAHASADCALSFMRAGVQRTVGCKKCGSVGLKVAGMVRSAPSAGGSCGMARDDTELGVATGKQTFGYSWFRVEASCEASAKGCTELNSCGTCTCGGANCAQATLAFSCAACGPDPLHPRLKRACVDVSGRYAN